MSCILSTNSVWSLPIIGSHLLNFKDENCCLTSAIAKQLSSNLSRDFHVSIADRELILNRGAIKAKLKLSNVDPITCEVYVNDVEYANSVGQTMENVEQMAKLLRRSFSVIPSNVNTKTGTDIMNILVAMEGEILKYGSKFTESDCNGALQITARTAFCPLSITFGTGATVTNLCVQKCQMMNKYTVASSESSNKRTTITCPYRFVLRIDPPVLLSRVVMDSLQSFRGVKFDKSHSADVLQHLLGFCSNGTQNVYRWSTQSCLIRLRDERKVGFLVDEVSFVDFDEFLMIFDNLCNQSVLNALLANLRSAKSNNQSHSKQVQLEVNLDYESACIVIMAPAFEIKVVITVADGALKLKALHRNRNAPLPKNLVDDWLRHINKKLSMSSLMELIVAELRINGAINGIVEKKIFNRDCNIVPPIPSRQIDGDNENYSWHAATPSQFPPQVKPSTCQILDDERKFKNKPSILKSIKQMTDIDELALQKRPTNDPSALYQQYAYNPHYQHHILHLQQMHKKLAAHYQLQQRLQIDQSHPNYAEWFKVLNQINAQMNFLRQQNIVMNTVMGPPGARNFTQSYNSPNAMQHTVSHVSYPSQIMKASGLPFVGPSSMQQQQLTQQQQSQITPAKRMAEQLQSRVDDGRKRLMTLKSESSARSNVSHASGKSDTNTTLNDAFSDLEALAAMGTNEREKKISKTATIETSVGTLTQPKSKTSVSQPAMSSTTQMHFIQQQQQKRQNLLDGKAEIFDFIPDDSTSQENADDKNDPNAYRLNRPTLSRENTLNSEESQRNYEMAMLDDSSDEETDPPPPTNLLPTLQKQCPQTEIESVETSKMANDEPLPKLPRLIDSRTGNSSSFRTEPAGSSESNLAENEDATPSPQLSLSKERQSNSAFARNVKDVKSSASFPKRKFSNISTSSSTAQSLAIETAKSATEPIKLIVKLGKQRSGSNSLSSSPSSASVGVQSTPIFSAVGSSTGASPYVVPSTAAFSGTEPLTRLSSHAAPPSKTKSMQSKVYTDNFLRHNPSTSSASRKRANRVDNIPKGSGSVKKRFKEEPAIATSPLPTLSSHSKSSKRVINVPNINLTTPTGHSTIASTSPSLSASLNEQTNQESSQAVSIFPALRNFKIPKVVDADSASTTLTVSNPIDQQTVDSASDKAAGNAVINSSNKSTGKASTVPPPIQPQQRRRQSKTTTTSFGNVSTTERSNPQPQAQHNYRPTVPTANPPISRRTLIQNQPSLPKRSSQVPYVNQRKPSTGSIANSDNWAPAFLHHREAVYKQQPQSKQQQSFQHPNSMPSGSFVNASSTPAADTNVYQQQIVREPDGFAHTSHTQQVDEEPSSPDGLQIAEDE